ncbi:MAG: PAS domain S-box protein [Planctomycetota bacterium]
MTAPAPDAPKGALAITDFEPEEVLRAILESSRALIVVMDRDGRVVHFNQACSTLTGYTEKQVAGRLVWEFLHADDPSALKRDFERLLAGEGHGTHEGYWVGTNAQRHFVAWTSTVFVRRTGGAPFVIWAGIDITERVRAEEQRRETVQRYRSVLDNAAEGIVTIDERGLIDSFNPAAERMFGYRADEVIGRNVALLMPPPFRDQHDTYIHRYLTTGIAKIVGIGREVVGLRKDGSTFPCDLAVSDVRDGSRCYFTGILRDITERKSAEKTMVQQEKLAAVGQLASGVAHEVGNPLASISAVVQSVVRKLSDPTLVEKLRLVEKHIHRISTTLQQMVRFARPSRTVWTQCSVNDVLQEAAEIVRHDTRARGISINLELAQIPQTYAMPDLLHQLFVNLALNAFDALDLRPPGYAKRLSVVSSVVRTGHGARIRVVFEDNGPGIAPEVVPHLIEPFFTTKEVGKGTGLGLAVSYRVVEQHGGEMIIDGRPGLGARFTIELPVYREPPPATAGSAS